MKKYVITILLAAILLGCAHKPIITGKSTQAIEKQKQKIEMIENSIVESTATKLDVIGQLAVGTDYSLSKSTNNDITVSVGKDLNTRIISIANKPTFEQVKEMKMLVDMLLTNSVKATKMLHEKDQDIAALETEAKILNKQQKTETKKYMDIAANEASKADQYKNDLSKYNGFWGLSAVYQGLKTFLIKSMWILGISGILFLVLRILSMSNPVAAGIFSIFNLIGSWIINACKWIFPKALESAGAIGKEAFNQTKSLLNKIVDSIQSIKEYEKKSGKPMTVKELLDELAKAMTPDEKTEIDKIKKELGY